MGWTGYHASYYTNRGTVDRKKELDTHFNTENENATWKVLKSSMVGSVYYAAVEYTPKVEADRSKHCVFGLVCLTSVDMKDYHNFSYKDMSEDMGPAESNCPVSILKLLSPTNSEFATEWRKRCYDNADYKKSENNPVNLPVGTVIHYKRFDGTERTIQKMAPAYQFKTPWWYDAESNCYVKIKSIPTNFEILKRGLET